MLNISIIDDELWFPQFFGFSPRGNDYFLYIEKRLSLDLAFSIIESYLF